MVFFLTPYARVLPLNSMRSEHCGAAQWHHNYAVESIALGMTAFYA